MKKVKKVFLMGFELLLIMVMAFLCVVSCLAFNKEKNDNLEEGFFGTRNSETIIELWHVETFEGGSSSREKYLEKRAIEFEKLNKGVFVLVKNVSEDELKISLEANKTPDFISFGYGVQDLIKDKLSPLKLTGAKNLKQTFLSSGVYNNNQLAVPYCYSRLLLFSTPEKLEKAGINENASLNQALFNANYLVKTKKKQNVVYSCVYGGLNTPGLALDSNNSNAVFPESANLSSFNAYLNFYNGKASILVGALRDLARLENKLNAGAISKLLCEPYLNNTCLTQNFGVFSSANSQKQQLAMAFIDYCLSDYAQTKVAGLGLLSPTKDIYSPSSALGQIEQQSKNIIANELF